MRTKANHLFQLLFLLSAACSSDIVEVQGPGSAFGGRCEEDAGPGECTPRQVEAISQALMDPNSPHTCFMDDIDDTTDGYVNQYWVQSEIAVGYPTVMTTFAFSQEYRFYQNGAAYWSYSNLHTPSSSYPAYLSRNEIINTSTCFTDPTYGNVQWKTYRVLMCTSGANCWNPDLSGSTVPYYNGTERRTKILRYCGSVNRVPNSPVVSWVVNSQKYQAVPEWDKGNICPCVSSQLGCE